MATDLSRPRIGTPGRDLSPGDPENLYRGQGCGQKIWTRRSREKVEVRNRSFLPGVAVLGDAYLDSGGFVNLHEIALREGDSSWK